MALELSGRISLAGLRRSELGTLWLAAPPVLVLILAGLVFELSAFELIALSERLDGLLRAPRGDDVALMLAESRARFLWATAVMLSVFVAIVFVAATLVVMAQTLSGLALALFVGAGLAIAVVNGVTLVLGGEADAATSAIFHFTYDSLARSGHFAPAELWAIKLLVHSLNALGVLGPSLGLMAACATLVRTPTRRNAARDELDHLKAQMRRLKFLLNLGSAMLVVGVLHMLVWLRWPAALVHDAAVAAEIVGLATALSLFWGAAFSLLIVSFYLPAFFVIARRAEVAIARDPERAGGLDARDWLKQQGLSITPTQQLPQVAVMLAPLLAGPIGTALSSLSSPLGGG